MPLLLPRNVFIICFVVALGALGSALTAQFVFDMKPCILCLWQRLPYLLIITFAFFGLVREDFTNYMLAFLLLAFIASFGLAFFHFGVEQHWWELSGGCPVESLEGKTQEQVLAEIMATPLAPCDKVAWRIFGQSITLYNAALSLVMSIYLGLILWFQNQEDDEA